jgi:hypothetical protein
MEMTDDDNLEHDNLEHDNIWGKNNEEDTEELENGRFDGNGANNETNEEEDETKNSQLYLENIDKDLEEIILDRELDGNLDLSVFSNNNGFHKLKKISFKSGGKITSLRNIPLGIEELNVMQNALSSISQLPSSLKLLNIDDNLVKILHLTGAESLEILHASNNAMEELQNIPKSIIELHLNNNALKKLDLTNTVKLTTLHCKNNPALIIINTPETLVDFQNENSPFANNIKTPRTAGGAKDDNDIKVKMDFVAGLNEYFRLKSKYEKDLHTTRKNSITNLIKKGQTKSQAIKVTNNVKPFCINCRRPFGTIFANRNEHYTAICGDTTNPCNLKIDIIHPILMGKEEGVMLFKEQAEIHGTELITERLNSVFGYKTEDAVLESKNEIMREMEIDNKVLEDYTALYNELYNNKQRDDLIIKTNITMNDLLEKMRKYLHEYRESSLTDEKNGELLTMAMDLYVKEFRPEVKKLRDLQYPVMEMNDYTLFQLEQLPEQKETIGKNEKQQVLAFTQIKK